MDADRFDLLTKSMAAPASRRRALGVFTAGGLFGGLARAWGSAAAQAGTCTLDFITTVRIGPTSTVQLTAEAAQPGEVSGELNFRLAQSGALEAASLVLSDGTSLPVVGQATGNSLQLRIEAGQGLVFVSVGVGAQAIAACQGAIDGLTTGPQAGDLGDFHAVATGQGTGSGTGVPPARPAQPSQPPAQPPARPPLGRPPTAPSGPAPTGPAPTGPSGPSGPSGPTGPSGPPGPGGSCPAGQTNCSGTCVDLMSDLNHCGACGEVCESRLVAVECRSGVCERATCEMGMTYCGAVDGCRDLSQDIDHCGGCQQPCADGTDCVGGVCVAEPEPGGCEAGLTDCSGECIDLSSHDFHCGACGNLCANIGPFHYCEGGVCIEPQCPAGTTNCSGYCADLQTSTVHCGACGIACAPGQTCTGGVCGDAGPPPLTCNPGLENCFGVCVDTSNDPANCGGCGIPCPDAQFCQSRVCVAAIPDCGPGLTACGGVCIDTNTDRFACGSCTNACAEGQNCVGGACTAA